jgi:hypothetical protein
LDKKLEKKTVKIPVQTVTAEARRQRLTWKTGRRPEENKPNKNKKTRFVLPGDL